MVQIAGFAIIFFIYFIITFSIDQIRKKRRQNFYEHLDENYRELKVPASKIEVLTNEYLEEVETKGSLDYKAIEALYDNNRNFTKELRYASTLVYYDLSNGKKTRFNSETIDMDGRSLKAIVDSKGSISIFFDRNKISNYYFDLSFLGG